MEITTVKINTPEDVNVIVGQSHFIKTVDDLYETVSTAVPGIQFGIAFCEASGACKIRLEGNNKELIELAKDNALQLAAGHSFIITLRKGFPINVLNAVKNVAEVCSVFAATANPLEVVIADTGSGRGILGVVDGLKPQGVENDDDIAWRKDLLKKLGYKR